MPNTPLSLFPDDSESIGGIGLALTEGWTTCAAVLERCFHQIDLWDAKVNAWVFVDRAGAMRQARALDAELKAGRCRGPLHGIPFGIKDIIDVAGMPTACGFAPWRDRVATADATLVGRLRDAGAVILGKTVTTQFAWVDPPPTRNPWNLERTPGGSSSGSAAAVATGMCLAAIGTQTGGSIIRPAAFCGVAGFKPSYLSVNEDGIFPFAPTLDHPGPFVRGLRDLGLIFDVIERGPHSRSPDQETEPRGKKPLLIRPRGFYDRRTDPVMLDAFEMALQLLAETGYEVVDLDDDRFDFEGVIRNHRTVMAAEAAATHESIFAEHRDSYAPHIRALVDEGLSIPVTRYVRALQERSQYFRTFWESLEGRGPQRVIVTPAAIGPAPDTSTTGNPSLNAPWSYLGFPAVTFPIALTADGLPMGLQFVGPPLGDRDLLRTALGCETEIRRASQSGSP